MARPVLHWELAVSPTLRAALGHGHFPLLTCSFLGEVVGVWALLSLFHERSLGVHL